MLEELKSLLSDEVMLLTQKTLPAQQVMERVDRLAEEDVDLKAAIDESARVEQDLDESFEMILWEKLEKVVLPNLSKHVLKSEILIPKLESKDGEG